MSRAVLALLLVATAADADSPREPVRFEQEPNVVRIEIPYQGRGPLPATPYAVDLFLVVRTQTSLEMKLVKNVQVVGLNESAPSLVVRIRRDDLSAVRRGVQAGEVQLIRRGPTRPTGP
jgi:hypothetical protein